MVLGARRDENLKEITEATKEDGGRSDLKCFLVKGSLASQKFKGRAVWMVILTTLLMFAKASF
ncbi:hypothetical protein [Tetragenococcus muriaticus]|uniref:hypothetical protein n=1 Tax=Tetragenococcus muriaticus TaxID=64642 RepID=UPI00056FF274|nr:hypothetical protein [Tetragenococcus muriaticus]